jgi:imidazole glycerol-phosphate synthase subunit HisF
MNARLNAIRRPPVRVVPRLDVKGPNLVKGIHLEGLRVLGDPALYAHRYVREGADELLFMDAVASLYGRNSLLDVVSATARDVFIPMTVGGGIRSLDDIASALRAGADKIAINTAAVNDPAFITQAAQRYGSSTIVVHIDAKASKQGGWTVWTENGREPSRLSAVEWAKQVAELGCGEILVTSIDREGTAKGLDCDLVQAIAAAVQVPVIGCGGASTAEEVAESVSATQASAVCIASILHYGVAAELEKSGYAFGAAGEFSVLAEARKFSRVVPTNISAIKVALEAKGLSVRNIESAAA